jgi:pimeloyl-ACP methyl ester carboxylesterase
VAPALLLFNRLDGVNERLVRGREDIFFGSIYAAEGGTPPPQYAIDYYVDGFASSPDALRGSFEFYRAWDAATEQNKERAQQLLTLPVLAIGGQQGLGHFPVDAMQSVANDVQGLIIPDSGHWLAEEAPNEMLTALSQFLAPYKQGAAASTQSRAASKTGARNR